MPAFRKLLNADLEVDSFEEAPMLRGIISRINDQPAEKVAGDHWVIQGDRGITYASIPSPETEITSGEWWPQDYTWPAQISFSA